MTADPLSVYGVHEPGIEHLMVQANRRGWLVFTHGLGFDPGHTGGMGGRAYLPWADQGFGILARLNVGYGSQGTIPHPRDYDNFARRVANWVAASPGCHWWIIGNEMNHAGERREGVPIYPFQYASCYAKCQRAIKALPGHADDKVVVGAVAPYNNQTAYSGNTSGDWIVYFQDCLRYIRLENATVDALALHAYTHGISPGLIRSAQKMGPPFGLYHYHFRTYRDFMNAIPSDLRGVPVHITECTQIREGDQAGRGWEDINSGWVQEAYAEINNWNGVPGNQQVWSLDLYRTPKYDQWFLEGKTQVHADFLAAMTHDYRRALPPSTELERLRAENALLKTQNGALQAKIAAAIRTLS